MPGINLHGRRRGNVALGDLPGNVRAGDYWRYHNDAGVPIVISTEPGNLTGSMWGIAAPMDERGVFGIGILTKHTVREHEDGTITVAPGDGSSNSILVTRGSAQWHGYIERGYWRSV